VIQSGRTDALIGKNETEFLEVKSTAYDLRNVDESQWKLELAKDVTQFANARNGGLLLIGYRTKNINGFDVIQRKTPVQPKAARLQTYKDVLKSRIHPPISSLQIGSIPVGRNEVIYFYIPPQPEENKPYIISGSIMDGCYDSNGISIVRRQGDASIPVTAQEIHAALVVGRTLIRGRGASFIRSGETEVGRSTTSGRQDYP
jgi:predicted HTH transcriptional regulator